MMIPPIVNVGPPLELPIGTELVVLSPVCRGWEIATVDADGMLNIHMRKSPYQYNPRVHVYEVYCWMRREEL